MEARGPFCSYPALGNGSAAGRVTLKGSWVPECCPSVVRPDSRPAPSPPERLPRNRLLSISLLFLVLSSEPDGVPRASSSERSRDLANLT